VFACPIFPVQFSSPNVVASAVPGPGKIGFISRRAGDSGHTSGGLNRVMEFQDKLLKCVDCGKDFIFTAGEQLFFHDKQFHNDPKRCKACKLKRGGSSSVRAETRTHCSVCGQETTVPFRPTQGRPVLCRSCFEQQRRAGPSGQPVAGGQPVVAAMAQPASSGQSVDASHPEAKPAG
jgi:CxxC-x17-CxxC domain-containing protein